MTDAPDMPKLDELFCFNTYALHHAFGRFYQAAFGETGFTYPKFVVLAALKQSGPMTLGALSDKTGVEANSLSPMIKRMASFGLVDRQRDPKDERRIQLAILPYGESVLAQAHSVTNAAFEALGIDADEARAAMNLMATIRKRLPDAPTPPFSVPNRPDETDS